MPRISARLVMLAFSLGLLLAVTLALRLHPLAACCEERRGLYALSLAALLVFSASIMADIIGVAAAIMELVFGIYSSFMGLEPVGLLGELGMLGGVMLMFVAGTEIEVSVLRRNLWKGLGIGLTSFLGPAMVSFASLWLIGMDPQSSALMAVALSTTSVAVVYAVLLEKGLLARSLGQTLLAAAMIADVASIVALVAIVAEFTPLLLAYMALFVTVPPLVRKMLHALPYRHSELGVRLIVSSLLALTLVSEVVGVHAILIAFILGMASSEVIRRKGFLDEKIKGLVFGFFAPIFFFTAGLYMRVSSLAGYLELVVLVFIVSYVPKVFFTYIAGRRLMGLKDPLFAVVFGARLTVSTIAALIGLSAGALSMEHYGAVIVSAVIATVSSGIAAGRLEFLGEEEI